MSETKWTPAQRAAIPSGAVTIVTVGSFSGGVNVLKALTKPIVDQLGDGYQLVIE